MIGNVMKERISGFDLLVDLLIEWPQRITVQHQRHRPK
tara:strand:+ start:7529 stop:7642 length:114 start_codon:yes stop_codon:yes gene_type:complete